MLNLISADEYEGCGKIPRDCARLLQIFVRVERILSCKVQLLACGWRLAAQSRVTCNARARLSRVSAKVDAHTERTLYHARERESERCNADSALHTQSEIAPL
jgi:hypothetical protein